MIRFRLQDFSAVHRLAYWRLRLWKTQVAPPGELAALQWRLLSPLLDHCFANVPFYREQAARLELKRSDIRSAADLALLPVIGKSDVYERPESFRADRFIRYRPKPVRTSGTTCSPVTVYWDGPSNIMELAANWRHYSWFGYRLGMPFMDIRNYRQHLTDSWRWNWQCRSLETSIQFWNESNAIECARTLRRYGVRMWRGHSMAIYELCRLFERAGIRDAVPKCIVTVGNMLLDFERAFIERWAGAPVADSYGLTEHTALVCRCPEGGYHIASEYGLVEILRENGDPAAPGEEGRLVSTGLHNRAFPLIRYDTGDRAMASAGVCVCGRTLPLLQKLTGRDNDRMIDKRGASRAGLYRLFREVNGVRYAQIVQERPGSIDVYIVPAGAFGEAERERIRSAFETEMAGAMEIRLRIVTELPVPPGVKFRFAVNRIPDSAAV